VYTKFPYNNIVVSLILGFAITAFMMLGIGAYFDSDERIFYYVINSYFISSPFDYPLVNNDFILFNVLLHLKQFCQRIDIFSCSKLLFFASALSILIYFTNKIYKNKTLKTLTIIVFVLLFIESFVLINHVRSATFFCFVAFTVLFLATKKRHIILFYTVALLAIMQRIEVSIIHFTIFIIIAIVFNLNKKILKHSTIVFLIGLSGLSAIWTYNQIKFPFVNDFFKYERNLEQNKNIILDNAKIQEIFKGNNQDKDDLIAYANIYFLIDEPYSKIEYLGNYVKHQTLYEYVFENPDFLNIYIDKLEDIYIELTQNLWNIVVLFLFFLILTLHLIRGHNKLFRISVLLIYMISLMLGLSVLIGIDYRVLQSLLLMPLSLMVLIFFYGNKNSFNINAILLGFSIFLLVLGVITVTRTQWKEFENNHTKSILLNNFLKNDKKVNINNGFILDFNHYYSLPSKIFSMKDFEGKIFSMAYFENLPMFKKEKKELIGEDWKKMPVRFNFLIDNHIPIYSDKKVLVFQQSYLKVIHGFDFDIEEDKSFEPIKFSNIDLIKYYLVKAP
jgi:hypothetical protein